MNANDPEKETNLGPSASDPFLAEKTDNPPRLEGLGLNSNLSIALSGGGYRAAIFHLGAIRRLRELGILAKIDVFSSVSGGSIFTAHLAQICQANNGFGDPKLTDELIEQPLIDFVRRDIRSVAALVSWSWLLFGVLSLLLAIFSHLRFWWPCGLMIVAVVAWNWRGCGATLLARSYRSLNPGKLTETPSAPKFIFCATDVVFGVLWSMTKADVGDYQVGRSPTPTEFKVADAVAASSCFPPVFFPVAMRPNDLGYFNGKYEPDGERKRWARKISLTDGGIYDNLGLEPVWKNDGATVLVCDGGGPLPIVSQRLVIPLIQRYAAIIQNQALALRKRMLIDKFTRSVMSGTYWGLASATEKYFIGTKPASSTFEGYTEDFVNRWIAPIRTDLAYFSPEEVGILINHGYTLAHAAISLHCPELKTRETEFKIPFPKLMAEELAKIYLRKSHKLVVLSRILRSFGRRASYFSKLASYR